MRTAVAITIFNSPAFAGELARRVAAANPPVVYVIADGPRPGVAGEADCCTRAREAVEQALQGLEIRRLYAEGNMGVARRLASGFDWVFSQEEEAIILEDDCWPDPTFFPYCDELLERYRNDTRVMQISGSNFLGRWRHHRQSYHFTLHGSIWGWATWRRAWQVYDFDMRGWQDEALRARVLGSIEDKYDRAKRAQAFAAVYHASIPTTWDYQWYFARLAHGGLSAVPAVNLVTNVGAGPDRAHFSRKTNIIGLPTHPLSFPLRACHEVVPDHDFDRRYFRKITARPWTLRHVRKRWPYWSGLVRNRLRRIYGTRESTP